MPQSRFRAPCTRRLACWPMLVNVSGINSSTVLWYASRATGVVALLLLTAVMLLGLLVTRQGRLPGLPRFAVTGLHRNLSLLAVVFVLVHVVTAVARRVREHPAHRRGRPAGVVLRAALARARRGEPRPDAGRRGDQPAAPPPVAAGLAGGAPDRLPELAGRLGALGLRRAATCGTGWLLVLAIGCAAAVVGAAGWRVAAAARDVPRAERVGLLMTAVHDRDERTGRDSAR